MNASNPIEQPAILKTRRLMLRPVELQDLDAMFQIKSDFEVTKRYGVEAKNNIEEIRKWLDGVLTNQQNKESFFWVILLESSPSAIGSVCFWNIESESKKAELGYELSRSFWHKGIMSEALPPVIEYGFLEAGFNRIEALPLAFNESSKNLLKGLGFKLEGTLRERILFRGNYHDQLFYALLRKDWNEKNPGAMERNEK